jgi:hypothetical protein
LVTLSGSLDDVSDDDTFAVTVDWGDGFPASNAVVDQANRTFTATKRYFDNAPAADPRDQFTIQATATDDDGGITVATTTITVLNTPPNVASDNPSVTVDEGQTAQMWG